MGGDQHNSSKSFGPNPYLELLKPKCNNSTSLYMDRVQCHLEQNNKDLWNKFHEMGSEMICGTGKVGGQANNQNNPSKGKGDKCSVAGKAAGSNASSSGSSVSNKNGGSGGGGGGGGGNNSNSGKPRRARTAFTYEQLVALGKYFLHVLIIFMALIT